MSKNSGKPHSTRNTKSKRGMETQIVVAIITAATTIILALFTFPPFVKLFQKDPTPTAISTATNTSIVTVSIEPTQATESNTLIPTATEMLVPTITQTSTFTPTAILTATPTSIATNAGLPIGMDVQLAADTTSGKSPLKVNFDARGSFLRDTEGKIFNCSGGLCDYTWYVYQSSKLLNKPESSHNGTFSYRFGNAGDYRVVVQVCRGQGETNCAYDAEYISVR